MTYVALLGSWDAVGPFETLAAATAFLVAGGWVETATEIWDGSEANVTDSCFPRILGVNAPADLVGFTLGDEVGEVAVDEAIEIARDHYDPPEGAAI